MLSYLISAITFQIYRVGNDSDAEKFLQDLATVSEVKDMVYCSDADLMDLMDMRDHDHTGAQGTSKDAEEVYTTDTKLIYSEC